MIIIVLGMHRSGTSALAGLLHNNGIVMGEEENFIPKPSEENIKGFFENFLFRRINDDIVEKCGYRIKSWDINIPHMSANIITRYRMRRLLQRYNNKYDKWGWKDPRTCLTLSLWLKELGILNLTYSCKILYIIRDPYSVAKSMSIRKDTDFENALRLWKRYNERVLEEIDRYRIETFYLNYEGLCIDPIEMARRIFGFIGINFDKDIVNRFITKGLNRSAKRIGNCCTNNKLDKEIKDLKERIYNRIS